MSVVQEKLKYLPDSPGVYIMLDADGVVIYVGKARVLKNRVRQYFHASAKPEKVMAMVASVADFSYIITKSEIDALALENNLIKKYKPKYNILLKDDKTYPYIKVYTKEAFPRFAITRKITKDGKYFGPFMGGINCKDILETLARWYDVDFFYQSQEAKDLHFTGHMERYKDIGVILESVTLATGTRFSIQGRTIVVSR